MKKKLILLTIAITFTFSGCNNSPDNSRNSNSSSQSFNLDTTKLKKGDVFYQCEMDPEVLSDKPGNCPKCGMELIEIKKQ